MHRCMVDDDLQAQRANLLLVACAACEVYSCSAQAGLSWKFKDDDDDLRH